MLWKLSDKQENLLPDSEGGPWWSTLIYKTWLSNGIVKNLLS